MQDTMYYYPSTGFRDGHEGFFMLEVEQAWAHRSSYDRKFSLIQLTLSANIGLFGNILLIFVKISTYELKQMNSFW